MRLAAIYNVFDGEEWLEKSIRAIRDHVDVVICITQVVSNWGETYYGGNNEAHRLLGLGLVDEITQFQPVGTSSYSDAKKSETTKRQLGIAIARGYDCTHFVGMDCDEVYDTEQFRRVKDWIKFEDYQGTVARIVVYFGKENLRFSKYDETLVPFIHKLHHDTKTGVNHYPHAMIDPTRRINVGSSYVPIIPADWLVMHHYSWVRNNIGLKVRNSTAKQNLERLRILEDYEAAKPGHYVHDIFQDYLIEA